MTTPSRPQPPLTVEHPTPKQARGWRMAAGASAAAAVSAAVVAVPAWLAALPSAASASPAAPRSGAALLKASRAAVTKQSGVLESVSVVSGSSSAKITAQIGKAGGEETGSFASGKQRGSARVISVGKEAYVRGDDYGLTASGLTAAAARAETNRWISMTTSKGLGASLSSGLTMVTAASGIGLSGNERVSRPTTVDGQRVIGVLASASGQSAVIYVRASGTPLPVEVHATAKGFSETVTFAHWGEAPHLVAPRPTVALRSSWVAPTG